MEKTALNLDCTFDDAPKIRNILERFDFEKVRAFMVLAGIKWENSINLNGNTTDLNGVPSIHQMKMLTQLMLEGVSRSTKEQSVHIREARGFLAIKQNETISLKYQLTSTEDL